MDDLRIGRAFRHVRLRLGWRQIDVARRAGVSQGTYSNIERGHLDPASLRTLRRVASVLEIRLSLDTRWRGGELARLVSARHAAMSERATQWLLSAGWDVRPEVSFNHFGERGVVDLVARHVASGTVLVVELKTELLDVGDLLATMDRRLRLAVVIASSCGWTAGTVGGVVLVADSKANRRQLADHSMVLRAAFPVDGRGLRRWLRTPDSPLRGLTFIPDIAARSAGTGIAPVKRVRRRSGMPVRAAGGGPRA
jgi:transcriptional regulator with XRE-family HTH domain